jgi:hypothetical protein
MTEAQILQQMSAEYDEHELGDLWHELALDNHELALDNQQVSIVHCLHALQRLLMKNRRWLHW